MLQERLNSFFFNLKKYVITKKNGYYQMPYVANSPQATIASMSGVPFNTVDSENNVVSTDNPFMKGDCHYQEIEKGLWILYSNLKHKKNISYKLLYDPKTPIEYYNIFFQIENTETTPPTIGGHIVEKNSCIFSKPGAQSVNSFQENTEIENISIHFSIEWLDNLKKNGIEFYDPIQFFIDSDRTSLFIPNFFTKTEKISGEITSIFTKSKGNSIQEKSLLKEKILELIENFLFKLSSKSKITGSALYSDVLLQYIYQPFPGVDYLAKEIGVSATKLKADFKKETGITLFQYFKKEQMRLAKNIVKHDTVLIKNIAYAFGYENTSKFSAAFKKYNGFLPSEKEGKAIKL